MEFEEIQRRSRELFRIEAADLVGELEAALLDLEQRPDETALINRVFRAMHTLKGSGATSGFTDLSAFLHHVEDVYNAARDGRVKVTSKLIGLTLAIVDTVSRYLKAAPTETAAILQAAAAPLEELETLGSIASANVAPPASEPANAAPNAQASTGWHIQFAPRPTVFQHGIDPGMFLDDLRALGSAKVHILTDRLPPLAAMDPESCYLAWEIDLTTSVPRAAVEEVFAFVCDDCDLAILPLAPSAVTAGKRWRVCFQVTAQTAASPGALRNLWQQLEQLGSLHVLSGPTGDRSAVAGTWEVELETAADAEAIRDVFMFVVGTELHLRPADPVPESTVAAPDLSLRSCTSAATPVVGAANPSAPTRSSSNTAALNERLGVVPHDVLRVSSDKLDRLVNLVGELVILRSQVSAACNALDHVPPMLRGAAEGLDRLSAEMRDVVLNVRMMPVGETLNKFRRLTRDMSLSLGKEVDLSIEGEATEMDKSMLDQLNDPLVHLVRNSLDHGIELPEERSAAGKPRRSRLRIAAEQSGDRICITVADDGRGLDSDAIRAKAIAQGLISVDANLSEAELHALIFLPGFSTARTVSEVSGRGVGMDVVQKRIEQMGGSIELHSQRGLGTEVRLSLPLTLAIIDGLMVGVGRERYIVPLGLVREIIERSVADHKTAAARNVISLRGAAVPFLRLCDVLAVNDRPPRTTERIVIVELSGSLLGLAVDDVLGSHQTVLKSLGWMGQRIKVFSGATITGDGTVALIIDVPALVRHAADRQGASAGFEY